ncbi:MAG: carboxymuconolactone decarboxylase family protein [Magnetospirillum sp.]|nr:carboxymuconolactone decarboxylase family protein [Magnetospirillum sp.]
MSQPHAVMTFNDFTKAAPSVVSAFISVGTAAEESGLEKDLIELIKIRVSQLNGCAFCLQYHLVLARGLEMPSAKLDLVAAWRDAACYSDRERAALAWAEALTALSDHHAMADALAEVQRHFTPAEIPFLASSVAVINAWNRLGAGLSFPPLG